jgi:hypothetical protein
MSWERLDEAAWQTLESHQSSERSSSIGATVHKRSRFNSTTTAFRATSASLSSDPFQGRDRCCSAVFVRFRPATRANGVADLIQFVAAPLTGMNLLETAMTCPRTLGAESPAKLAPQV